MRTEYDHEAHRHGISASDIGAIVGVNPYKRPIDVWAEKLNRRPPPPPESDPAWLGKKIEPVLGELYSRRFGKVLIPGQLMRSKAEPWQLVTPDFIVEDERIGVEAKTANLYQAKKWGQQEDAIDLTYLPQIHWSLHVTGFHYWDVVALVGGEPRFYRIRPDRELEALLEDKARRFWEDHVLTETPPPPDESVAYTEYLAHHYRHQRPELLLATPEIELLARYLETAERTLTTAANAADKLRNEMRAAIGAYAGVQGLTWKALWTQHKDRAVTDWEAVARALSPTEALIATHTTTKQGPRPLRMFWGQKEST
jgi:putative phage-type endonuclease